jgi:DNA-binding response OmpR family regulator
MSAAPPACPPYAFDLEARTLSLAGRAIDLTPRDFALALHLFRHPGRPWTRDALLESVWGTRAALETRTVDTHIARLRRSLDLASGHTGWRLVTVVGRGYRLERVEA